MSGVAPRGCSICRDPRAPEIDAAVANGVPNRVVGTRYGLGRESVRRHRMNHLPGRVRAAAKAHQGEPATDILERLREVHVVTQEILTEAREAKDRDSAIKLLARLERQLELEGRLLGIGELAPAGGGNTINVLAIDAETGRRIAQVYLQRHGTQVPALPPSPIESEALEPESADVQPLQESA